MIFITLDVHLSLFFRLLRLSISDETMNLDHQLKDTDDHHDFLAPFIVISSWAILLVTGLARVRRRMLSRRQVK